MTKRFPISELERIVHPAELIDVLSSLSDNGLLESFSLDYRKGEVEVIVPKNVEVSEVIAGFQEVVDDGRKKGRH